MGVKTQSARKPSTSTTTCNPSCSVYNGSDTKYQEAQDLVAVEKGYEYAYLVAEAPPPDLYPFGEFLFARGARDLFGALRAFHSGCWGDHWFCLNGGAGARAFPCRFPLSVPLQKGC